MACSEVWLWRVHVRCKRPATTPTAGPHPVLSLSRRALPSPKWAAGCRYPGCAWSAGG